MASLLAFLAGRMTRSKSYIVALLYVFSPGCSEAFFPVGALFGTTSAGEWAGLAVLIAHGEFAQQIGGEAQSRRASIAWEEFAGAMRCIFAPIRHPATAPPVAGAHCCPYPKMASYPIA
jgi:hypothetical protein